MIPDNFESQNSVKLSFTNIRDFCFSFAGCKYFLASKSEDISALCATNLEELTDSSNFPVRGYLPLIWMYSATQINGFAIHVYVKERLPFVHRNNR